MAVPGTNAALRDVYPAAKEISRPRRERGTGGDPPLRRAPDRQAGVFADGDALVLPTRRLLAVLQAIREHLPEVERVSSYCLPRNLRRKSVDELRELADAGLRIGLCRRRVRRRRSAGAGQQGRDLFLYPGCAGKAWRGGDQSFGDDPQRSGRNDPERAARGQLRAPDERRPAGVPVDPGGEFPYRRAAFPCWLRRFRGAGSACPVRRGRTPVAGDWSSKTRYFAATTLPTIWCSRASWVPTRRACWPRSARPSSSRSTLPCARSGSVACDGAEAASARHSPVFRRRQGR